MLKALFTSLFFQITVVKIVLILGLIVTQISLKIFWISVLFWSRGHVSSVCKSLRIIQQKALNFKSGLCQTLFNIMWLSHSLKIRLKASYWFRRLFKLFPKDNQHIDLCFCTLCWAMWTNSWNCFFLSF